jgi:hypothetical protein
LINGSIAIFRSGSILRHWQEHSFLDKVRGSIALICLLGGAVLCRADWPQYGGGAARTFADLSGTANLQSASLRSKAASTQLIAQPHEPAVVGQNCYAVMEDGSLVCRQLTDLSTVWAFAGGDLEGFWRVLGYPTSRKLGWL